MNIFTNGCELSTAITNLLIASAAIYSFINTKDKSWKTFFMLLAGDGILGFIIHGISFTQHTVDLLWLLLLVLFSFTINVLLTIFLRKRFNIPKYLTIFLTAALYIILFIEAMLKIEFLYTFIAYACVCLILILIMSIKNIKNNKYYYLFILGFVAQLLGAIFLLDKTSHMHLIWNFDKNGIYHIYMVFTTLYFYLGAKRID